MDSKPSRILTLGDSYTIGAGGPLTDSWPYQLTSMLQKQGVSVQDPVIIAERGWTSLNLLNALEENSPRGIFDLVTLLIGVNDQYNGIDPDLYKDNFLILLDLAISYARAGSAGVLVLSIPDWSVTPHAVDFGSALVRDELNLYNKFNHKVSLDRNTKYVDIAPLSREAAHLPELLSEDGIHPSREMYRFWAELILPIASAILEV